MTTSPDGTPAQPAQPPERVVARLRPNARRLFWPSLVLILTAGALGFLAGRVGEVWEVVLLWSSAAAVVLLLFLLPLAAWLSRRYTITTRRLIIRHGFFVRVRQELLHSRGYDVSVRRTWLQSVFRSGDVLINSGLDHPVVLKDVPRADQVQRALSELMDHSQTVVAVRRQQSESVTDETTVWGSR
ncbi:MULTISPECIES: PH domain-containing protein [unclassified Leifsonia]|uniref:PH domain-containing protein n=1 Tax=unclassified Leifsonia TaxID=2663824 RepID=UPI0008A7DFFD|nr:MULTISPECIES: PH domain-containing protein [unclassified Leifsonia]SEH78810.1 membrane protein YdbS, contains bPH2 (pleckstrin homology) domain [Leifsonia sp. CL154]SFL41048.1 membrane protein YdbS, contains bPH2 (pleckstrin homology) domain [Leifsonia sp. CL147]